MSAAPRVDLDVDQMPAEEAGRPAAPPSVPAHRTPAQRRHELVSELFLTVCDLSPNQQRELLSQGHIDPSIAAEVFAMLDAEQRHATVLEPPLICAEEILQHLSDPEAPEPIEPTMGAYQLEDRLGEGAYAVVYRAAQQRPVRRTVAVKVLRNGVDGGAVRARFELERQALAIMRHPHIAQLYDAGLSGLGRPYFAMEFVDGSPIVEYCVDSRLPTRRRIELFLQVCDAVQHAHLKGIIHRDLKPSNILVTQVDGTPFVKVIDFGIARALEANHATHSRWTMPGDLVGTLEYMSPEQARGELESVDTLSDVYSLGVILYELLAGRRPYSFTGVAVHAAVKQLLEQAPPRLSRDDPSLRGDLELIVSRAMARRSNERYTSVALLADDLRRVLEDEPISVRPESAMRRLGRLARKHRAAAAAAAAVMLILIAASGVSGIAWWRARSSYLATVGLVEGLLGEALAMVDSIGSSDLQRALLERSLAAADAHLARSPRDLRMHLLRLRALDGLGDLDLNDGRFEACRTRRATLLTEVTELLQRWPGDPGLRSRLSIAMVKVADLGQMLVPPIDPMPSYLEALAIDESLATAHPDNAHYLDNLCWSYERVAAMWMRQGHVELAVDLHRRRLALAQRIVKMEPDAHLRGWNLLMAHANMASLDESLSGRPKSEHVIAARKQAERIVGACPQNRLYLFYLSHFLVREASYLESIGRADEAAPLRDRAESLALSVEHIDSEAFASAFGGIERRIEMASLLMSADKLNDALTEAQAAGADAGRLMNTRGGHAGLMRLRATALQMLATIHQRRGDPHAAMICAAAAAAAYRELCGHPKCEARTLLEFAQLLQSFEPATLEPDELGRAIDRAIEIGGEQPQILRRALELCEQGRDTQRADAIRLMLEPARHADVPESDIVDLTGSDHDGGMSRGF